MTHLVVNVRNKLAGFHVQDHVLVDLWVQGGCSDGDIAVTGGVETSRPQNSSCSWVIVILSLKIKNEKS